MSRGREVFDNMLVHLQPSALLQIVDAKHTKQAKDALNRLAREGYRNRK